MSIEFKNVEYTYLKNTPFENKVLHDVNFKINKGEIISIIGHTGSGKSTLVQLMNLLLKGFSGDIIVDSSSAKDKKVKHVDIRKKFGFSFQYPEYQFFEETIYKDISFSLKVRGESDLNIERKVRGAMKMVSLDFEKYKDKSPFEISGGEKRKVSLASMLVLNPEYIILDEPTVGLDPKTREEIILIIERLNKEFNKTIIIVTHIMDLVYRLSHRVMLLNKGKIISFEETHKFFMNEKILNEYLIEKPYLLKLYLCLMEKGINLETCPRNIYEMENVLSTYFKNKREGK